MTRRTLLLLFALTLPGAALAQGNLTSDSLGGSGAGEGTGSGGTTAQVGAGTDNGTTTGFSEPADGGGGGGPPALDASLCADFEGSDAHADCLSKVIGSGGGR